MTESITKFSGLVGLMPEIEKHLKRHDKNIDDLKTSKAGVELCDEIIELQKELSKIHGSITGFLNKAETCSNFMDKYLPAQVHRETSRFLNFVLGTDQEMR